MKIKTLISILLLVCTSCAFFVPGDGMIFISGRIKKLDLTESKIDELNCVIELYLAEKKDIIYASKTLSLSRGKFKTSFIVSPYRNKYYMKIKCAGYDGEFITQVYDTKNENWFDTPLNIGDISIDW